MNTPLKQFDIVIVGSGAAGLSAALYARRYQLQTLVIVGELGGETATAGKIENYPGILEIDGYDLISQMKSQAEKFGAEFKEGWVNSIKKEGNDFLVSANGEQLSAKSVILAIGSKRRHLNLPNEKELTGKGVHYCVTCDGPVYAGKTVAMVGGGDSSVKGVIFLSEYAEKIYLIVREKEVRAEPVNLQHMEKLGNKVEILLETEVKALVGESKLEKLVLSKPYRGSADLRVDGVFIEIGYDPDTTFSKELGIVTDEKGYMKVDAVMGTNVRGVFVAGDSTNHFGRFKQDITASALGAVAATSAYEYLKNA